MTAATGRPRDDVERLDRELRAWAHLAERPQGGGDGPLAGWTVGVKDLIDVAGMPTGGGSVADRPPAPAAADAPVVARLRAAGATLPGKTTAVEYGWFGHVHARNPWDQRRSPGGSSSGSAVAVAARMCRAALGTQTAGSVVRPAAYTGVVALKLTHGAVPTAGWIAVSQTLDSLGVFARGLDDVESVADAVADAPLRARWDEHRAPRDPGRPLRLGVLDGHFDALASPAVRGVVAAALDAIADGGVEVVPVRPPVDWAALAEAHGTIMLSEMATERAPVVAASPAAFSPELRAAVREGEGIDARAYGAALAVRAGARERRERAVGEVDAWLTPAATSEAPPAGDPGDAACSVPFSALGYPALALPAGLTAAGLPVGLQLVSGPWRERALIDLGRRLAAALPDLAAPEGGPDGD